MRYLPVGDAAVLVELDDLASTLALFSAIDAARLSGVTELVPGARTILVRFDPLRTGAQRLVDALGMLRSDGPGVVRARTVEIPVRYDGEDLAEVADLLGLSPEEVIRRHTDAHYTVAFTGFAPGFAYLASDGENVLEVPRRGTPRTRIPAGAVGLAGSFSGVYPRESPGGWQIIGVTDAVMWDLGRPQPALLQPGDQVRFVDATGLPSRVVSTLTSVDPPTLGADAAALEVLSPGVLALLQDDGRAGNARLGVSPSGALDAESLRAANRLVGNTASTAAIEVVYGGFSAESRGDTVVAVTGASVPITVTRASGRSVPVDFGAPFALAAGDRFTTGVPEGGIRSYVAVRGGFAVEPVLGSLSTDTLSGLGPAALAAGTVLPVAEPSGMYAVGVADADARLPTVEGVVTLDLVAGPRTDWFTADALELLCAQTFTVSAQSNRVGLRLEGPSPLERAVTGELPSEGTIAGALQVPPSGQPVLFLADHPLTGGYPVIACVASHHLRLAGQLPVGAAVRFRVARDIGEYEARPGATGAAATIRSTEENP